LEKVYKEGIKLPDPGQLKGIFGNIFAKMFASGSQKYLETKA